jgi:hypothetical protein
VVKFSKYLVVCAMVTFLLLQMNSTINADVNHREGFSDGYRLTVSKSRPSVDPPIAVLKENISFAFDVSLDTPMSRIEILPSNVSAKYIITVTEGTKIKKILDATYTKQNQTTYYKQFGGGESPVIDLASVVEAYFGAVGSYTVTCTVEVYYKLNGVTKMLKASESGSIEVVDAGFTAYVQMPILEYYTRLRETLPASSPW